MATPSFADLIKAYNTLGATTTREVQEGENTRTYTDPTDLGGGWMAWEKPAQMIGMEGSGENATPIYAKPELGGFSQKEGDYVNFYDLNGNVVHRQKWNESALKSAWQDVGPVVMAALTAGGAGGALGNAILGQGANQIAANALGGALLGGGGAAIGGGNVLKGALLGGAGGALVGYLNPASGQITATPADGAIPVTADDIASLGSSSTDLGIDYSLNNGTAMKPLTDMGGAGGIQPSNAANLAEMGGGQGFTFNVGAPVTTVADAVKAIATMNGSVNPANLAEMGGGQGLTYQTPSGLVTEGGTLNFGGLTGNNSVIGATGIDTGANIGSDIVKRVAAIDTGVNDIKLPATPAETPTKSPLTVSDAIRLAGIGATLAGGAKALSSGGGGAYDIVPIPSEWTSPIQPTTGGTSTGLTPIDFGSKELLRGTQWERLLSPDYGKAPAMPTIPTNPSNMTFDQLTKILGNSRESIPTQNLSINDVIAGIQSQYGQKP